MSALDNLLRSSVPWEDAQVAAAAREAAQIGGRAGDEGLKPAQRPLIEAGEGESEGFELAEADLIAAAEHRGPRGNPLDNAFAVEAEQPPRIVYAEADEEHTSGRTRDQKLEPRSSSASRSGLRR